VPTLEIARRGGPPEDFGKVAALRSQVLFENCIKAMDETGSRRACAYLTGFHRICFIDAAPRRGIKLTLVQVTDPEFQAKA